jgi:phenylacetate-coenzyme A ligase PaaK-like adenylate-forming protein
MAFTVPQTDHDPALDGAVEHADRSKVTSAGPTATIRDLSPEALHRLLSRMREMRSFRDRYPDPVGVASIALSDLPVLTKDDFRTAFPDTLRLARSRPHGALVLGSGGTTSAPKLSLVPSRQMISEIHREWHPLDADDVLINYDTPGRLCSSHNFFNALADASGAVSVPLGSISDADLAGWLEFVDRLGATALNATQSQIAHLLEFCETADRPAPQFRKLLWTGEAYGERAEQITRRVLPGAALHGVYGSTETWVIGHNGPACDLDTFHVMPYQHVELLDGLILVTNLHPECVNPVVRYRLGDRGRFVDCPCGRPEPALKVLGRDDPQLKFLSILFTPQEVRDVAQAQPGVADVQLALFDYAGPAERMELRVRLTPGADPEETERLVAREVLRQVYRLGYEVEAEPHAFAVRAVQRFSVDARSGKTPLLVKESQDGAGTPPQAG